MAVIQEPTETNEKFENNHVLIFSYEFTGN